MDAARGHSREIGKLQGAGVVVGAFEKSDSGMKMVLVAEKSCGVECHLSITSGCPTTPGHDMNCSLKACCFRFNSYSDLVGKWDLWM